MYVNKNQSRCHRVRQFDFAHCETGVTILREGNQLLSLSYPTGNPMINIAISARCWKWGNSEITLFFIWMGPLIPSQGCWVSPVPTWGGQQCGHVIRICVCMCAWYKIFLLSSALLWHYTSPALRKIRFKFSPISLPLSLWFPLCVRPSTFHLSATLSSSAAPSLPPSGDLGDTRFA